MTGRRAPATSRGRAVTHCSNGHVESDSWGGGGLEMSELGPTQPHLMAGGPAGHPGWFNVSVGTGPGR